MSILFLIYDGQHSCSANEIHDTTTSEAIAIITWLHNRTWHSQCYQVRSVMIIIANSYYFWNLRMHRSELFMVHWLHREYGNSLCRNPALPHHKITVSTIHKWYICSTKYIIWRITIYMINYCTLSDRRWWWLCTKSTYMQVYEHYIQTIHWSCRNRKNSYLSN